MKTDESINVSDIIFDSTKTDFRNNYWGDTHSDVYVNEGMDYYANPDHAIAYEKILYGHSFKFMFYFDETGLSGGIYSLNAIIQDLQEYVNVYYELAAAIVSYEGESTDYSENWRTTKRSNRIEWGIAIAKGNLDLCTIWITQTNMIVLELNNKITPCHLSIAYSKPKSQL